MEKMEVKLAVTVDSQSKEHSSTQESEIYVDPALEKRVMSKFDWLVCPQLDLILTLCLLDRSNIGNAVVFGFSKDLHLKGIEFNNLSMFFYVLYVPFEIPWVMAVKKFGPNKVLAVAMISWSIVTIGTGFIHNYHQAIACRLLLGLAEAGMVPALDFTMSTIYTREHQAKRLVTLSIATAASSALGGLIAYGIQSMGMRRGLEAWRWLFIIEGVITIVLGGLLSISLPKSPETAWFLTKEEKAMMAARKERDIKYRGTDEFSWKWARLAFQDPFVYLAALAMFCSTMSLYGMSTFLPTILRGLRFSSLQANYLTIPVYVFAMIVLAIVAYVSDKIQRRGIFAVGSALACATGYAIAVAASNPWVGYFAMFVAVAGIYPFNLMVITWSANNIVPEHKRAVAMPLFFSLANSAGFVSSQMYPSSSGPRYVLGNSISLGVEVFAALVILIMIYLCRHRNHQKQKLLAEGVTENRKDGDEALNFIYIY